jgi:hypothetical protein
MNAALNTYDGLTAHYYASRKKKGVIIGRNSDITFANRIAEIDVSGKVEARRIAKEYNARPWNF